jgi:WD40 repeat protein
MQRMGVIIDQTGAIFRAGAARIVILPPMIRRIALAAVFAAAPYQAGPPPTDVYLATLTVLDGKVVLGTPANISKSPGYDNQPAFTPDGRSILFTSVRGDSKPDPANAAASGSDIYRYEIASGRVIQVTSTPESEYSPTVTPDGTHVSVIRVERDGTQRLWRFTSEGSDPELVLPDVKPVGYHAWADANTLALFVLGRPNMLQIADVRSGKAEVVATDIGRSLGRTPGGGISYVQREPREGGASLEIMQLDAKTRQKTRLVRVSSGPRDPDLAWTPDGWLLMAHDGKLYGWRPGQPELTVVADLGSAGLRGVTRLAMSPGGDRIAIVAEP